MNEERFGATSSADGRASTVQRLGARSVGSATLTAANIDDGLTAAMEEGALPSGDGRPLPSSTPVTPKVRLANLENVSAHHMYLSHDRDRLTLRRPASQPTTATSTGGDTQQTCHVDRLSLSSFNAALSEAGLTDVADSDDSIAASCSSTKTGAALTAAGNSEGEERDEFDAADYAQLDRYGFIIVPPAKGRDPEGQSKSRVGLRGSLTEAMATEEAELKRRQEQQGRKEAKRALKWLEMLKTLEPIANRREWPRASSRLEARLCKGIPECLRSKVWALFLQPPTPSSPLSQSYRELYLRISGFERQIDLDIERTLRDHILFRARFSSAQVSLFKILVAYSNADYEVGYCQGMSMIAAFLLLYYEEEMAFQMLRRLMERDRLRTMFLAGFPLLFECFWVQEQLMRRFMPVLLARLQLHNISTSVYATKWYLTLFLGFPFSLATRIWDLFLFYGVEFLICVALALLKIYESRLLGLEYEPCMQLLSRLPENPIDESRLIALAGRIWRRINPKGYSSERGSSLFDQLCLQYGKLSSAKDRAP